MHRRSFAALRINSAESITIPVLTRAGADWNDRSHELFRRSDDRHLRRLSDLLLGEDAVKVVDARDRSIAVRNNDISILETGRFGRTALLHTHHEHAVLDRQVVEADHATMHGHRLPADSDVAAS